MANMHLVTGYAGAEHVTAEDHGNFNAAMFGSGQYVLNVGNKLAASVVSSNQVRILDGDILMQGRHVRLNEGTYVDLTIENGTQGMLRNDLVVARYTKNSSTGVEEVNLVVIKGTAVASSPADPDYTVGDLLEDHAILNDMPLYRISLDGINVQTPVALFSVNTNVAEHAERHAKDGADPITPDDIGALGEDSPFLWRTVDLVPLCYPDVQEFTYEDYGTTKCFTITLPNSIDLTKYDYQTRLEVYGATHANREVSSTSGLTLFTVVLGGTTAGLVSSGELWQYNVLSTIANDGTQSLTWPHCLFIDTTLNSEKGYNQVYGYKFGEVTPCGEYLSISSNSGNTETKVADVVHLCVSNLKADCPAQTFGIRFSYRAVNKGE